MVSKIIEEIPIILLNNVQYTYPNGSDALKKINLNIKKGEIVGIMGQNGAGKTTLIKTFNGLIRPLKGTIYIDSEKTEPKSIAYLSRKVGIIFQNPDHQLFSNTVEDEIKFSLKSFNLNKDELQSKIDNILKTFNLEKYRERSPLNLSGGEKKKLATASIICRDPDILVFDEPTLGQDAKEIKFLIDLIKMENAKGKTIIIVTHNIEFALDYIPRIIIMANGKIIGDGPTSRVLTNELLITSTSLILPQSFQFIQALKQNGIQYPEESFSKELIINFLSEYLTNKSQYQGERN